MRHSFVCTYSNLFNNFSIDGHYTVPRFYNAEESSKCNYIYVISKMSINYRFINMDYMVKD